MKSLTLFSNTETTLREMQGSKCIRSARIARKVSKKQLELEIEMRYAERKLSDDGYDALKAIVSRIARICGGNEEKRREITSAVLEAIEPFVRRE